MSLQIKAFSEASGSYISEEKFNILRLIRSENIGIKTFYSLIKVYGSASKALESASDILKLGGKSRSIKICSAGIAEQEIEACEKFGARIITYTEDEYPSLLKQIPDAPPVITVLGNVSALRKNCVAIVGSRNASANGCRFAYKIADEISDSGYIVVSGLARGIDSAAHKGSLEKGTIAVIAGGIDNIYPKENEGLYNKIRENGAIVAELPFGSVPKAQNFPQRNRIISGLSLGTAVVECSARSGSLITARFALEHNREVFAVPGSPLDPRAEGPNKLIKQGAQLIESGKDIIENLANPNRIQKQFHSGLFEDNFEYEEEPEISVRSETDVNSASGIVSNALSTSPISVDELISLTNLPLNIIQVVLLDLELSGKIIRHAGNRVSLLV